MSEITFDVVEPSLEDFKEVFFNFTPRGENVFHKLFKKGRDEIIGKIVEMGPISWPDGPAILSEWQTETIVVDIECYRQQPVIDHEPVNICVVKEPMEDMTAYEIFGCVDMSGPSDLVFAFQSVKKPDYLAITRDAVNASTGD